MVAPNAVPVAVADNEVAAKLWCLVKSKITFYNLIVYFVFKIVVEDYAKVFFTPNLKL